MNNHPEQPPQTGEDADTTGWIIEDGDQLLRLISSIGASEAKLSRTEAIIAELKLLGLHRKEIATKLGRSLHTVDHHLKSIRRKLKGGSSTALFVTCVAVLNRQRAKKASEAYLPSAAQT